MEIDTTEEMEDTTETLDMPHGYIPRSHLTALVDRVTKTAAGGDTRAWQALHAELCSRSVQVILPIGEMTAQMLDGFWYAWELLDMVPPVCAIPRGVSLGAQGLKAVHIIDTDLMAAIHIVAEVGTYRCAMKVR